MTDGFLAALFGLFVILSAFFSGSETALTSLSDAAVFRLREDHHPAGEILARLRSDLSRSLSTLLIGNTLANIAAGSIGTALVLPRFGGRWGVAIATGATTLILLVASEVTPKMLAARRPVDFAAAVAHPVELLVRALSPVSRLLTGIARLVLRPFGRAEAFPPGVTGDDVRDLISLSHQGGALETEEKEILHAVLEFGDIPVKDVMTPRGRMVSLDAQASFADVEELCKVHRYSRYPVWRSDPDDVVGILHVKDLFQVSDDDEKSFQVAKYLHPAIFVPELKRADDLFREMRRRRFHMAIVVGERGAVSGFVTLENLVERILGDIADEHDEPADTPRSEGTALIFEGRYPLATLEKDLRLALDEPDVETAGGFLLKRFGRIPRAGARLVVGDLEFLVERASPMAIERIRVTRKGRKP
jgi:putative hemolysin